MDKNLQSVVFLFHQIQPIEDFVSLEVAIPLSSKSIQSSSIFRSLQSFEFQVSLKIYILVNTTFIFIMNCLKPLMTLNLGRPVMMNQ